MRGGHDADTHSKARASNREHVVVIIVVVVVIIIDGLDSQPPAVLLLRGGYCGQWLRAQGRLLSARSAHPAERCFWQLVEPRRRARG